MEGSLLQLALIVKLVQIDAAFGILTTVCDFQRSQDQRSSWELNLNFGVEIMMVLDGKS